MRLTKTQERALRAKQLLDSGMDPKEAARECGYKNVNGMMGAVALCLRKLPDEDAQRALDQMREAEAAKAQAEEEHDELEPVIGELPEIGEVLVGERIPQEELQARSRAYAEQTHARMEARSKDVRISTARVTVALAADEHTGGRVFKLHIHGIDKWITVSEVLLGGSEALARTLGEIRTAIDMILEAID